MAESQGAVSGQVLDPGYISGVKVGVVQGAGVYLVESAFDVVGDHGNEVVVIRRGPGGDNGARTGCGKVAIAQIAREEGIDG